MLHWKQQLSPAWLWYVPGRHEVQDVSPALLYVPAEQMEQPSEAPVPLLW